MIVLIIKKHKDYKWLPGTKVECTPSFGNRLIVSGNAVEGYDTLEEYKLKSKAKKKATKDTKKWQAQESMTEESQDSPSEEQ